MWAANYLLYSPSGPGKTRPVKRATKCILNLSNGKHARLSLPEFFSMELLHIQYAIYVFLQKKKESGNFGEVVTIWPREITKEPELGVLI